MNERIRELAKSVQCERHWTEEDIEKFAELIVRECADAADMAYDARCKHPGDYVGEQLGYGEDRGITAWRVGVE